MTAGIYLTVPSVTLMLGGTVSGSLYNRVGPRRLCIGASVIYLASFLLLSTFGLATTPVVIVLTLALLGFGLGLYYSPNTSEIMCLAPREKQGMVSSLATTERNAGATIGIVVFELAFIQSLVAITAHEGLTEVALASQAALLVAPLAGAFDIAFFVGAVVSVIVLILAFFTPDPENAAECEGEEAGMMV